MATDQDIDDLLRQDEAELRAKRKRLKAFSAAIEDVRRSQENAATLSEELISSGDLTRSEIGRVFKLSRAEKTLLVPTRRSSGSSAEPNHTDTADEDPNQPEDTEETSEKNSADRSKK